MATGTGRKLGKLASNINRSRRFTLMHDLSEAYSPTINRRHEKLMELIKKKTGIASRSKVARKLHDFKEFWKVEMTPPRIDELQQIKEDIAACQAFVTSGGWKQMTVKRAWLFFLVGIEVACWFYLGETVGKMHIVGYSV